MTNRGSSSGGMICVIQLFYVILHTNVRNLKETTAKMTNQMKRNAVMSFVLWTFACLSFAAAKNEAQKVRAIIDKVNNSWQSRNKPEATPFWHVAAYHTGNMEAYRLTGNKQ